MLGPRNLPHSTLLFPPSTNPSRLRGKLDARRWPQSGWRRSRERRDAGKWCDSGNQTWASCTERSRMGLWTALSGQPITPIHLSITCILHDKKSHRNNNINIVDSNTKNKRESNHKNLATILCLPLCLELRLCVPTRLQVRLLHAPAPASAARPTTTRQLSLTPLATSRRGGLRTSPLPANSSWCGGLH